MVGNSALRNACRARTTRSGRPLARANSTYGLRNVSSMLDRVIRDTCAIRANVKVAAGSMRCEAQDHHPAERLPAPPEGSHCR